MKGWLNQKKAITAAVDKSSVDTGNEGEENVEKSIAKAVQVDSKKKNTCRTQIIADRKNYIATRNSFKELIQHDKKRQQII